MPTEQPKENKPMVEGEIPTHIERKLAEYGVSKEFVKKYSLELAEYYCQPKIDVKVLAEKYGSKLRWHYSFPMLENSYMNRKGLALLIDAEGGAYITHDRGKHRLMPAVICSNTSKELAEEMASLMGIPLSNPHHRKNPAYLPCYLIPRRCIPAIDIIYLIRPYLRKRENVESADKIIEMFKEKSQMQCDENGNPLPRPEPKYVTAYKLRQDGVPYKEIAEKLECSQRTVYCLIYRAKNLEKERRRIREWYYRKRLKSHDLSRIEFRG